MPIVYCPNCAKKTRAPDSAIGKRGQCPTCHAWMRIPERDEAPPTDQNAGPVLHTPPPPPPSLKPSPNENRKATAVMPLPPNASGMLICVIVYMGATILDLFALVSQERGVDLALTAVSLCALVALAVFTAIFIYRAWACLPAKAQHTSPGLAAGLLFVPLFNCYWAFIAIRGLAARTIEQTQEHTSLLGLATALSVLFVVCQITIFMPVIAFVGIVALVVVLCLWAVRQETATGLATGNAKPASKGLAIGALATTAACVLLMIGVMAISYSSTVFNSRQSGDSYQNYAAPAPTLYQQMQSAQGSRGQPSYTPSQAPTPSAIPSPFPSQPRTPPTQQYPNPSFHTCSSCNGSGTGPFQCSLCGGSGAIGGVKCSFCKGKRFQPCQECGGRGVVR